MSGLQMPSTFRVVFDDDESIGERYDGFHNDFRGDRSRFELQRLAFGLIYFSAMGHRSPRRHLARIDDT
jgi:hypothetical protein